MSKLEKIKEKLKNKIIGINAVDVAYELDDTPTKKYAESIVRFNTGLLENYISNLTDELRFTAEKLMIFDSLSESNLIENKDILSYKNFSEVSEAISEAGLIKSRGKAKKEIQVLFEDDVYLIFKPLSFDASKVYGSGTKWCTTQEPYFYRYADKGVLIYVINKQKNQKFGIYYDMRESYYNNIISPKKTIIGRLSSVLGEKKNSNFLEKTVSEDNSQNSEMRSIFNFAENFSAWTDWDEKIDMIFIPIPEYLKTLIIDNCKNSSQNLSFFQENNINEYRIFHKKEFAEPEDTMEMGLDVPENEMATPERYDENLSERPIERELMYEEAKLSSYIGGILSRS